jgi:hypothetical protein
MPIKLPLNSRYLRTEVIKHKGKETVAWWEGTDWLESAPRTTIVATSSQAGRADLIANQFFGSSDLWWVILYYNKQTDINWPRPGDEVAIPKTGLVLGT